MADGSDQRYVIDQRRYRSDRVYVWTLTVFWLVWAPMTAFVTYLAFTERNPFLFVWLVFGYLGTVAVPFSLYCRNRKQILEVDGEMLLVYGAGVLPRSRVRIGRAQLRSLTLEFYEGVGDGESVYTLNLFYGQGSWSKRVTLAPLVHPRDKAVLLEEIRGFLERHGFTFEVKNEGPR